GQLSSQEITSSFAEVFGMAISATEIEFVQHSLSLNSIRKDAINYASLQKIIVDGLSWKNLSYYQQVALVIHEYLGVMGINDQRGQYSNYFFRMALNLNSSYANLTGQPGTEIFVYDQLVSTLQQLTDKEEKRTLITSILKVFFAFDKVTFQNPNSETELRLAETIATGAKFYLSFDPTTQSFINLKGERLRTQSEQDQSSVIYAVRRAIIFDSDLMATTFTENWQNQTCNLNIGGNLRISKTVEKMGLYMVLLKQCNGMWAPMPETNYIKTLDE
ncbi:MAG TPA: hypothetical protein VN132_02840, partial [Bdellovibrio sp.]|nr:hypothetical protein [Bdellovibrio sp.]